MTAKDEAPQECDDQFRSIPVLTRMLSQSTEDNGKPMKASKVSSLLALARNTKRKVTGSRSYSLGVTRLQRGDRSYSTGGLQRGSTFTPYAQPTGEWNQPSPVRQMSFVGLGDDEKLLEAAQEEFAKLQNRLRVLASDGSDVSPIELKNLCDQLVALDEQAFEYGCQRVSGAMELFEQTNAALEEVAALMESQSGFEKIEVHTIEEDSGGSLEKLYEDVVCVVKGCLSGVCAAIQQFLIERTETEEERQNRQER